MDRTARDRRREPGPLTSMPADQTGEVVPPSEGTRLNPTPGSSWGTWPRGHPPTSPTGRTRRLLGSSLATLLVAAEAAPRPPSS